MHGLMEKVGESLGGESITFGNAGIPTVARRVGEERRADVVGSEDDFDGLLSRRNEADDTIEVGDEFGGISFAREGKHAKEMVRAKADGHSLRILCHSSLRMTKSGYAPAPILKDHASHPSAPDC
jgi:hypothetical protein